MPSGRLQQQFIRLWQCCEGKSQETTLNDLAALLSCSRRHMRTLLNTMEARAGSPGKRKPGAASVPDSRSSIPGWRFSSSARRICWSRIASINWCNWSAIKRQYARCWSRIWGAASVRVGTFCGCSTIARCTTCCLAPRFAARKPTSPADFQRLNAGK